VAALFDVERWPSGQGRCETSRFHHRLSVRERAACPLFAPTASIVAFCYQPHLCLLSANACGLCLVRSSSRQADTSRDEPRLKLDSGVSLPGCHSDSQPEALHLSWRSRLHRRCPLTTSRCSKQTAPALSCSACWSGCSFTTTTRGCTGRAPASCLERVVDSLSLGH
jgi:hypothetical protein